MDWNDVRHFLALARLGSVRAAGASLEVSHSTVARRVEALEERLSARLFDRNRDGYVLTEVGRQLLPAAERIEQEMTALERGLVGRDDKLAGTVTLTCSDSYVAQLLLAELAPFCAQNPEIELSLVSDARAFDLARREADIALRLLPFSATPPAYLIGQRAAAVCIASYVATQHADALDPDRPGAAPRWIGVEDRAAYRVLVDATRHPGLPIWGTFASVELMVHATRAGLGLALLPTYVGDREPALRRLAQADVRHVADLWLLSHPDLRDNARIRATRTEVARVLRKHEPLFRGEAVVRG